MVVVACRAINCAGEVIPSFVVGVIAGYVVSIWAQGLEAHVAMYHYGSAGVATPLSGEWKRSWIVANAVSHAVAATAQFR